MSHDNERAVEAMSEDERDRHRKEIVEQLGPDVMNLIRMARDARQSSVQRNGEFTLYLVLHARICTAKFSRCMYGFMETCISSLLQAV